MVAALEAEITMNEKAVLQLDGKAFDLPIVTGTESEKAVDISALRDTTGYITLDDGSHILLIS